MGQIGDGTKTLRSRPVPVGGGLSFRTVSAGFQQTCGVTAGGLAYCWGDNARGQLGDGTKTQRSRPVPVAGGMRFHAVSTGPVTHSCGVTTEGAAYCWGFNGRGQLGDGTTTDRKSPVRAVQ